MRSWKLLLPLLASTLCFGAQADRITGAIDSSQMVALTGNIHGFAQPRFDLGRTDGGKLLYGVALAFRPSAAQQTDLNNLLAQQQDRSSPNYHKWLTPAQFADRFGMTQDDINRVQAWLESQGFTVTSVANSRNQISFDGTVAQVETAFRTEIHNYLVDGEIHFANSTNPSVPAALAGAVLAVGHLHNFSPKPRAKFSRMFSGGADPHFTSHISGDHFLTPGDFATIYNIPAGLDGTGQTIAIVGQSSVSASDLSNFRSAAGLSTKAPQYVLYPSNSTSTRCAGDEGESDLDLEWSGGVAQNANIIFVYAGLVSGDSCGQNRTFSVWDALQQTVDNNYAPVISTSYGFCESGLGAAFVDQVEGWAQQANTQGQTIMAASGDSGAADCDPNSTDPNDTLATEGLAVDVPAAIPEVTGMGGNEFTGDAEATPSGGNAPPTTYWAGTTNGTDTISSALTYIQETGWNDTTNPLGDGEIGASGGGASIFFSKPSWQPGSDGKRDVPDLALNASALHDPYLICSEDGENGAIVSTCTSGFRDANTDLDPIGGTSCAAPTFAAIVALLNESLGSSGLGNINPSLYALAVSNPTAFHDVTTGNNIVPCKSGTPDCPSGTTQFGFSAGVGYDQVTGLGSVNAGVLFAAWPASRSASSIAISHVSATNVYQGTSVTFTVAVSPSAGVGSVSFSARNNGSSTALGTTTLNIPYQPSNPNTGTATFTTSALPPGTNSVTATYQGDATHGASTSVATTVNVTVPFTMSAAPSAFTLPAGQTATSTITLTPASGFTGTVSFTNSTTANPGSCTAGLPAGALCSFSQGGSVTLNGSSSSTITMTITTAANMAVPATAQAITVTGTSGGAAETAPVSLTVTPTNQTFTLTPGAVTYSVATGATVPVNITVAGTGSPINFVTGTTAALPISYTCTGLPAESSCTSNPGNNQPTTNSTPTITIGTTAATGQLRPPFGRSNRIFYALLLPGLLGIVFAAGSRTRSLRLLSLIVVLGFSTLGLVSCGGGGGGSSGLSNPGTPTGSYTVTINATTGAPAGGTALTNSFTITLNVTAN